MRAVRLYATVVALIGVTACADNGTKPPPPPGVGQLTLVFTPTAPQATGLTLTSATVHLEGVSVIGDLAPDPRTMLGETGVDMLGAAQPHVFDMAPQGLYSRVHFRLEESSFQGSYNGTPIQALIEYEMSIDLRDPVGQEVFPGHDAVFTLSFEGTAWFGNLLSQTVPASGKLTIDSLTNNTTIAMQIAQNVAAAISLRTAPGPS